MAFSFATCVRPTALQFIQAVYPNKQISDTPDSAGPLLDFVQADIVRIQDPMMHGNAIQVIPGRNWDESKRDDVIRACQVFHGDSDGQ